jgi:ketosteroid isomerase-like protein
MSRENVEIVRRVVEAVNTGELPRELVAQEFVLTNATTAVTDATYHGYEGALKWRAELFDVVEDARYVLDEVIESTDDHVVIANRLVGRGASSGAPVDLRWTSVFWISDGQVTRAAGFGRRRDALQAVGRAR